jgi:hypothetical protein
LEEGNSSSFVDEGGAVADVQQSGVGSAMRASLKLRKFDRGTTGTLSEVRIAGVGSGGEEQNRAVPCARTLALVPVDRTVNVRLAGVILAVRWCFSARRQQR